MAIAAAIPLKATQKSLLFVVANYAGSDNTFWPSYQRLADDSGMEKRTAIRIINEFVKRGLLEKTPTFNRFGQTTNMYKFLGAQWCQDNGYTLEFSKDGFIKVKPPAGKEPNYGTGCHTITPPVT